MSSDYRNYRPSITLPILSENEALVFPQAQTVLRYPDDFGSIVVVDCRKPEEQPS